MPTLAEIGAGVGGFAQRARNAMSPWNMFPQDPAATGRLMDYARALPQPQQGPTFLDKLSTTTLGKMAQDVWSAVKAPGDAYAGRMQVIDPTTGRVSDEAIKRGFDLGGLVMSGGFGGAPGGATLGSGPVRKEAANTLADLGKPGITAYHGSPHSFDRFDMSKIGTGEGAQAYGHGLYFAENEKVAKGYRDNLAQPTIDNVPVSQITGARAPSADDAFLASILTHEKTYDNARFRLDRLNRLDLMEKLDELKAAGRLKNEGSMYEVRINADPEHFLDWDKPLAQQPDIVKRLTTDAYYGDPSPKLTGKDIIENVFTQTGPARRSEAMREAGIPGIKYLDAGSRTAGDGSRNYVVFDDKLIEILRKYGWVPGAAIPTAAMYEYQKTQQQPQQAARPQT